MMGKKAGKFGLLVVGAFLSSLPFVSAVKLTRISEGIVSFYRDLFAPIIAALFGQYNTNEFLFARFLLFLLLIFVIFFALQKAEIFGNRKGLIFLVSFIVSLLGIRFLPENDLINGVLLPYGVLGIALTTFLPFLIYFFFVHNSVPGNFGRRAAWAFYGIIFVILLLFRWDKISPVSEWIYLAGTILIVLAFIFDKNIHSYFGYASLRRAEESSITQQRAGLQSELAHLRATPNWQSYPDIRGRVEELLRTLRELH